MRSPANPRKSAVLVVLAVAALSALAGCYTVLKHPPTAEVLDGGEARRDCFDCHGGTGPGHVYDPMVAFGFDYLDDDWYPWYAWPWWYRDYWYWDTYHHSDGGAVSDRDEDDGRRHLWGPGIVFRPPPPPHLDPVPGSGGVGSNPPPGNPQPTGDDKTGQQPGRTMKPNDPDSGGTQGSTGSGSGNSGGTGGSRGSSNDNKDDKKKDEKDRNAWNRGGSKGGGRQ